MLRFILLQRSNKKCKIKLQGTGLEPASVKTIRFRDERGYQFRHPCKSKIHNSSIKLDFLSSTLINLNVSIPISRFYQLK